MIQYVPQLINLFATLILLLSFAMISQRRIVSLINLFMIQGAALVLRQAAGELRVSRLAAAE